MRTDGGRAFELLCGSDAASRRRGCPGDDQAICEENPAYGYRRVDAELRHRGLVVNAKKVRRLMAANGLNPKRRRRYVVTTDSNHDGPIFPHIARGFE